jgi:hypothetical protein
MHRRLSGIARLIVPVALLLSPVTLQSADPLTLRQVMADLGQRMQAITAGISREDWPAVSAEAGLIAGHPQPSFSEKMRIMGFAGTRVNRFRTYDADTRTHARAVGLAAKAGGGHGVAAAFVKLQDSCQGCHQEFRKAYIQHFRGTR